MSIEFNEILFMAIPERYHQVLELWASERNFRSSSRSFTPDKIAAEIVCEFIDNIEQMELRLQPDHEGEHDKGPDHDPDINEGSLPTPDKVQE
jgi:hypothetical protein